jgi:error-prone DNA polymerase
MQRRVPKDIRVAGLSAGEADQLRRTMAAWKRKGGLQQYYDRIVNGMLDRGYDREFAESIFAQIQGFGEYGLPRPSAARRRERPFPAIRESA